ncbi:MAG: DNA polymerase IV [Clostridia bacterium]|nr:DNA polymerase IV [Clostridia bacterium]
MRTILHSDLNNFYASVECVYRPELKAVPMAVCGDPQARHGIVLAKNMLAKRAGVQTGEAVWQARQKCPGLVTVPPNHDLYLRFSRMMRQIYADYAWRIEPFGLDEAWLDVTGHAMEGPAIADELRMRAREELGLTLSVGVSFNKVFAKLGSDMKKPDATTVITPENYRRKVWPLPAGELLFVGPATRRRLAARNLRTIGDIARCPVESLASALGKNGEMLWRFANGLDRSPVMALDESAAVKSVGNSTTTPRDIRDERDARMVLMVLSESVAERLRAQGLRGRVVCLSVRDVQLRCFTVQRRLARDTALASEICGCAQALLREHYRWERPLRSLGVSVSALRPEDGDTQLTMFPDAPRERQYELEHAVEDIRRRFGHFSIQRASLIGSREFGAINPRDDHVIHPVGRYES